MYVFRRKSSLLAMIRDWKHFYTLYSASCASIGRKSPYTTIPWQEEAVVYVHWPYCESRCTYCNFNKYINNNIDQDRMKRCLFTETNTLLKLSGVKNVSAIFFGGGTPSLACPRTIETVIRAVSETVNLHPEAEITIEANPTSAEKLKLRDFKTAGINRISLGIQSLCDRDLKVLGRQHSAQEALKCLEVCKMLFPGRTSVDIIFGRPGQTVSSMKDELNQVLKLCDDHISLYQLTLKRGTELFKKIMNRELFIPDADKMADFYEASLQILEDSGFKRYEVSNFAKTKEAESLHNKAYWTGSQYIGIGPGAHGRFVPLAEYKTQREARIQTLEPEPWMLEVERSGHGTRKTVIQSQTDMMEELLLVGLRTKCGIAAERWLEFSTGPSLQHIFADTYMGRFFQSEGFLEMDDHGMRATEKGLNVIDSIIPELLRILNTSLET